MAQPAREWAMDDSISIISDVHIRQCHDEAYQLLMSFFRHPAVKLSKAIYLLGDIFDCMGGRQKEYLELYQTYFQHFGQFLNEGKEIHYFQGNHDIHVELNYRDYFRQNNIADNRFTYHSRPLIKQMWGKVFFFAHGDEIEIGNWNYKIYRAIITSSITKFLAENILSYQMIHRFFEPASDNSRSRGQRFDPGLVREKFRIAAARQAMKGYDYVICGHSHIKEDYTSDEGDSPRFTYLNNGYALTSHTFIHLREGGHSFVELSPS